MILVRLPLFLAEQAGGVGRYDAEGATAAEALRGLPVAHLLFDERGDLRPLVNVYVDGVDARDRGGIEAPLEAAREIRVVAAIAGG